MIAARNCSFRHGKRMWGAILLVSRAGCSCFRVHCRKEADITVISMDSPHRRHTIQSPSSRPWASLAESSFLSVSKVRNASVDPQKDFVSVIEIVLSQDLISMAKLNNFENLLRSLWDIERCLRWGPVSPLLTCDPEMAGPLASHWRHHAKCSI